MAHNVIVSLTSALPGKEEEFALWFDEHLREVLHVEGVRSARRFSLAASQLPGADASEHGCLAIYEIDGDTANIWSELTARRTRGLNVPKRGIDDARTRIWAFDEVTSLP